MFSWLEQIYINDKYFYLRWLAHALKYTWLKNLILYNKHNILREVYILKRIVLCLICFCFLIGCSSREPLSELKVTSYEETTNPTGSNSGEVIHDIEDKSFDEKISNLEEYDTRENLININDMSPEDICNFVQEILMDFVPADQNSSEISNYYNTKYRLDELESEIMEGNNINNSFIWLRSSNTKAQFSSYVDHLLYQLPLYIGMDNKIKYDKIISDRQSSRSSITLKIYNDYEKCESLYNLLKEKEKEFQHSDTIEEDIQIKRWMASVTNPESPLDNDPLTSEVVLEFDRETKYYEILVQRSYNLILD